MLQCKNTEHPENSVLLHMDYNLTDLLYVTTNKNSVIIRCILFQIDNMENR